MAYTTIDKRTLHFDTKLYTGTGNALNVTGLGFQPDWTFIYNYGGTYASALYDAVRGVTKHIESTGNSLEQTVANTLTSFNSDGFSLGADTNSYVNRGSSPNTYVSWNWKAGTGAGSSNTDGSINTISTSVNTTAGFSISKYTGTGSVATIGHGLGAVPNVILVKRLTGSTSDWRMYHSGLGNTKQIFLNGTGAQDDDNTIWNDTSPTSSVFTVGTNTGGNASGSDYVAYCFTEKVGYSKFGTYDGNNNANGRFIYLGFKPAFILVKKYYGTTGGSGSGDNWEIIDTTRDTFNVSKKRIFPNTSAAESNNDSIDIVSNGFKIRTSAGGWNENDNNYLYWAFGQTLVGSNNVPCTAR